MKTRYPNRELRDQRADLLRQAKALTEKGNLSASEQRQFDSLMTQADEAKAQYTELENRMLGEYRGGQPTGGGGGFDDHRPDERETEHRSAFRDYLRVGLGSMDPEKRSFLQREYRDMGTGGQGAYPGATSGFFVPVGFVQQICSAMRWTGPLVDPSVVEMMDTSGGNPLPYPTENDTAVFGERVGENQQVTSQDVAIGNLMLGAVKYSSRLVKVSIELMQDSAFDMEAFLINAFAKRLGRSLNQDFTLGRGSSFNEPLGIVTSTLASGTLLSAVGSASNDGSSASTNTIGSDDLIDLEHSIDVLYRPGASYMAHDSTWKAIRKIKDKYGRPLWAPALTAGQPDTINGYPMLVDNFLDTLQVSPNSPPITRNSIVFGNFKRFLVRRVREMSVLRLEERFADFGQVAFLAFARYDSTPLYAGSGAAYPFAILQNVY